MTDKRSVFTDALETLGTIIDDTQKRDAIHLAVEPVVAKNYLRPGEHVTADGIPCYPYGKDAVGIVDPFVICKVGELGLNIISPGERFWLVLYPRTIKSLRHVWEHPAFPPSELQVEEPKEDEVEKSKKWIEDWIANCGEDEIDYDYDYVKEENLTYENLMRHADYWVENQKKWSDCFYVSESLRDKGLPDEFWHHYEIITGKKVEEDKKRNFFTCSC